MLSFLVSDRKASSMATRYPISNSLIFTKVMSDNKDLCIKVVERVLGFEVQDIEYVHAEHMLPSIKNRSVQLDVIVKATGKIVNLEMQTYDAGDLARRMRVHRSLMDATQIAKGEAFEEIDDNYVVFICTFDLFREGRARYTFRTMCEESTDVGLCDGAISYVYNAAGNLSEVEEPIAELLQYVLTNDVGGSDDLVQDLARAVEVACESEELKMGIHTWEQEMRDRYNYGVRIGREEGLQEGFEKGAARMNALFAAMIAAGVPADDIVTTIAESDVESLCERYGV